MCFNDKREPGLNNYKSKQKYTEMDKGYTVQCTYVIRKHTVYVHMYM